MSDFLALFVFIGNTFGLVFGAFDQCMIGEHSILDIFIALLYLDITIWFIFQVIKSRKSDTEDST